MKKTGGIKMSITEKMDNANESTWLSDFLSQEERITAKYIGQIASVIQRQRKEKGYTQHELANKLGVSQVIVSRLENGEEDFTITTLAKISTALEIEWHNPLEKRAVENGKSVAKLAGSEQERIDAIKALIDIIPNDGTTLEEIREERLARYETID